MAEKNCPSQVSKLVACAMQFYRIIAMNADLALL
jgi:hypothetical protein